MRSIGSFFLVGIVLLAITDFGYSGSITVMEPTQGRARFVQSDALFYLMFRADQPDFDSLKISLRHSLCPSLEIELSTVDDPIAIQEGHWVLLLKVPKDAHPGVYDLAIESQEDSQRVSKAVKVIDRFKAQFRFIHLSNMNIGDPTAPDFDDRLVDEINLLNPEFIISTGDYIDHAYVRDDSESWLRVKEFFSRFHAPAFILCGDQDHALSYPHHIAPSLVGTFDYGPHHFFFMMDTAFHPIENDRLQLEALIKDLRSVEKSTVTFLVGKRDSLGVLDGLQRIGEDPAEVFTQGNVRFLISGGSTDWDYREHAGKLNDARLKEVNYIRTGQSSTSMKNGGSGVSRYRVFSVNGPNVHYAYADGRIYPEIQSSIPAGRLRVLPHGPNDGSQTTEQTTIVNGLGQSFADCRLIFRLSGSDPQSVSVVNGRIEQVLVVDDKEMMVLTLVDLPEKSSVRVLATTEPEVADEHKTWPLKIEMDVPPELEFQPLRTASGLDYYTTDNVLELTFSNRSDQPIAIHPHVTLEGQSLIIRRPPSTMPTTLSAEASGRTGQTGFELSGGETITVTIKPALRTIRPGLRLIQVYDLNDPLRRAMLYPVQTTVTERRP